MSTTRRRVRRQDDDGNDDLEEASSDRNARGRARRAVTTTTKNPSSPWRRRIPATARVLTLIAALAIASTYAYRFLTTPGVYLTTLPEQPLVTTREGFLDEDAFARLRACALEHPRLRVESALNSDGFAKTRGFVVKFNEEGERDVFRRDRDYECFVGLFDELRLPLANAFVMNLLMCELEGYDAYDPKGFSVGLHLDDTVGIDSKHTFLAHQVSVLYLSVPEDMDGGELHLFEYGAGERAEGIEDDHTPDRAVTPKENLLVTFRGDAYHRVRSYRTRSKRERVSIVVEQYFIDDAHVPRTIRFEEAFKSNMSMM
jgi:hypothetical protein